MRVRSIGEQPARPQAQHLWSADQAQAPTQAFLAGTLSRKSYEVLGGIGTLFQSVDRSVTTGKA